MYASKQAATVVVAGLGVGVLVRRRREQCSDTWNSAGDLVRNATAAEGRQAEAFRYRDRCG